MADVKRALEASIPHTAFVSAQAEELRFLREAAKWPCLRNGFDPFAYDWSEQPAEDIRRFISRKIKSTDIFIGIYHKDLAVGGDEEATGSGFEFGVALEALDKDDIYVFIQRGAELDRGLRALLEEHKKHFNLQYFDGLRDFVLVLDEALKDWGERSDTPKSVRPDEDHVLSISVECQDRHGVLSVLTRQIFAAGGNILRARQTTHLHKATLRIIAEWPGGGLVDHDGLRRDLEKGLEDLHGDREARVQTQRVIGQDGVVQSRGIFDVSFFDSAGVAERIFMVFTSQGVSVIESTLKTLSSRPPIGHLQIVINTGSISDSVLKLMSDRIQRQAGVFRVDRVRELGHWWY